MARGLPWLCATAILATAASGPGCGPTSLYGSDGSGSSDISREATFHDIRDFDHRDSNGEAGNVLDVNVRDGAMVFTFEGRTLLEVVSMELMVFQPAVSMTFGFFDFERTLDGQTSLAPAIEGTTPMFLGSDGSRAEIRWTSLSPGVFRISASVNAAHDGCLLKFSLGENDRFWGFGEQYNSVDFRGWRVPTWVQEQGVGRSASPQSVFVGELTDSYYPVPAFIDPVRGYGFLMEGSQYTVFDLGKSDRDVWSVEQWNSSDVGFVLFTGPTPLDVVSQFSTHLGRPDKAPPDWAFSGTWIAAQGGTEKVRARVDYALNHGIPVSAVWVQDWVGLREFVSGHFGVQYQWTHDNSLYPGLEPLIAEFKAKGVRFLGYFNPFVVQDYSQYEVADKSGYLIKQHNGKSYDFVIITFMGSLLDVFNAEAAAWFQRYAREAAGMGMSGWMADFGEWLPFDSITVAGPGNDWHNLYPQQWHDLNRQVLEEETGEDGYVLLTRSGYTGHSRVGQVVWAGDQEADWSLEDGLPTVVNAGLTIGMTGVGVFSHDIGGFSGGPRDKELYMRWTELGALTPVMRTHDGLKKLENVHFDSDTETTEHFRRMAVLHSRLFPLWKELVNQYLSKGHPMIRHTAFEYPEWPAAFEAHSQWMLGHDLLVAPVLAPGESGVRVLVPPGEWEHLLTGQRIAGPADVVIMAPLGTPAILFGPGFSAELVEQIRASGNR